MAGLRVRDSPFFRPPFGARNDRIDQIAADQGHPTIAMWNGTLDDSRVLTPDQLIAAARKWFAGQAIVVGDANRPTVTTLYGDRVELIPGCVPRPSPEGCGRALRGRGRGRRSGWAGVDASRAAWRW